MLIHGSFFKLQIGKIILFLHQHFLALLATDILLVMHSAYTIQLIHMDKQDCVVPPPPPPDEEAVVTTVGGVGVVHPVGRAHGQY